MAGGGSNPAISRLAQSAAQLVHATDRVGASNGKSVVGHDTVRLLSCRQATAGLLETAAQRCTEHTASPLTCIAASTSPRPKPTFMTSLPPSPHMSAAWCTMSGPSQPIITASPTDRHGVVFGVAGCKDERREGNRVWDIVCVSAALGKLGVCYNSTCWMRL